jgi:steroid 5-alpha reductase family enzyme
MPKNLEQEFILFEASLLSQRYDRLKDRDYQNFLKQTKLFTFLILYGAAPFVLDAPIASHLLRAWGLGGVWLVVTVLFYCDRDFRAYGLHLKERVYCLKQLSVLRKIAMSASEEYVRRSLLPVEESSDRPKPHHSFPERLSSGQIRAASYFFKFLGFFPLLYLSVFAMALTSPQDLGLQGARSIVGVFFLLAPVISAWLYFSELRCLDIQRLAFEARRITPKNHWPRFEKRALKEVFRTTKGSIFYHSTLALMFVLSVICTIIFGYALYFSKVKAEYVLAVEMIVGSVITGVWLTFSLGTDRFLTRVLERMGRIYEQQVEEEAEG